MTRSRNPKRQPIGVPTGGQFAHDIKSEAAGIILGRSAPSPEQISQAVAGRRCPAS